MRLAAIISEEAGESNSAYVTGVTEAVNLAGEEFGEARLLEWWLAQRQLAAAKLQAGLCTEITNFHAGDNHDDATVLVVARN